MSSRPVLSWLKPTVNSRLALADGAIFKLVADLSCPVSVDLSDHELSVCPISPNESNVEPPVCPAPNKKPVICSIKFTTCLPR